MADQIIERSTRSLGGRLMESIKGVLVGLLLFLAAFPTLFFNEGCAVKEFRKLKEGLGVVVSVRNDAVDTANEGKLVHVNGKATTREILEDNKFGVSANAIHLYRKVEMYQWVEETHKETRKLAGGKEETITRTEYKKKWQDHVVDSSDFKNPNGHVNPRAMEYDNAEKTADDVTLGAFALSDGLIDRIQRDEAIEPKSVPLKMKFKAKLAQGGIYVGDDPANPEVGDYRIKFSKVPPTDITIVARQTGNSFSPYMTSNGELQLFEYGVVDAKTAFGRAKGRERVRLWGVRLGGFLMMLIGMAMVFRPLKVVADIVPLVGNIVGMGTGIIAFVVAAPLTLITVAVAWIYYRPVLAVALIVAGLGIFVGIWFLARKRAQKTQPAAA